MGAPPGGFKHGKAGLGRGKIAGMDLYVRRAGKTAIRPGTAAEIDKALRASEAGKLQLGLSDGMNVLVARRRPGGLWRANVVDRAGEGAMGSRWSARNDLDEPTIRALLHAYAAGDPAWRGLIAWKRGLFGQSPALLIPLTLFGAATIAMLVMAATGQLKGWSWRYLPNLIVGIGMIAAVIVYIDQFFRRLRPKLAHLIGRAFGLRIVEVDPILGPVREGGLWSDSQGRPAAELLVTILDLAVIFLGLVTPIAIFCVATILAARPILA